MGKKRSAREQQRIEKMMMEGKVVSIEPIPKDDTPTLPTDISVVTKESVEKVLDEIDSGSRPVPKNRDSTNWCLVERGRHYPPKYVLHRARKIQGTKRRVGRGGLRTNIQLQNLGYVVIEDHCGGTCNFSESKENGMAAIDNEKTRHLRWVEDDTLLRAADHGVDFLYSENGHEFIVAFLEGFGWRNGGPATIRLAKACPMLIVEESWSEIIASTRQAVGVFLSNDNNLDCDDSDRYSFRHGPIHIDVNG
jgi:hypothetical protein